VEYAEYVTYRQQPAEAGAVIAREAEWVLRDLSIGNMTKHFLRLLPITAPVPAPAPAPAPASIPTSGSA
jgi:hypothetical protein